MKITKFEHSCLLVEMPAPLNRTALFDPGSLSSEALRQHDFEYLDDIVVTHDHFDHMDIAVIKELVAKFPDVRIVAPQSAVDQMAGQGITATAEPSEGMVLFKATHEIVEPLFPTPAQIGVHYLDALTHPGDSLSFTETKQILALPVEAPWGSQVEAIDLAIRLKPKHVIPIHDWMWKDDWRRQMYDVMAGVLEKEGIVFHKLEAGQPMVVDTGKEQ